MHVDEIGKQECRLTTVTAATKMTDSKCADAEVPHARCRGWRKGVETTGADGLRMEGRKECTKTAAGDSH